MSNKLAGKKKEEKKQSKTALIAVCLCAAAVVVFLFWSLLPEKGRGEEAAEDSSAAAAGETQTDSQEKQTQQAVPADVSGPVAVIQVKDYGRIVVQLDEKAAPLTVENFVTLAQEGFYDGLTFHRVIDGFMIQGGDPLGNGTGGSDQTIKGEFSQNGVDNPISHQRGVISMARSQDMDSASSQFFIVQSDSPHLDGSYAGFGYVTEGMELVDQICQDTPVQDNNGTVKAEDQPVIESITIES